jgi:nitrogen regulatory protein PII
MFFIVVNDEQVAEVVAIIRETAFTGYPGDGKIFVTPLDTVYTVRTGKQGL